MKHSITYFALPINIIILVLSLLFIGCATIDPHENFKDHLYQKIDMNLDEIPSYWWPYEEDLIDSTTLQNGNIEKRYEYLRTCRYIYEINPKTNKIVGARFEGKKTDCVVNP